MSIFETPIVAPVPDVEYTPPDTQQREQYLRIKALELATTISPESADELIEAADKIYKFSLTGDTGVEGDSE
jgi:hypothetical protein